MLMIRACLGYEDLLQVRMSTPLTDYEYQKNLGYKKGHEPLP